MPRSARAMLGSVRVVYGPGPRESYTPPIGVTEAGVTTDELWQRPICTRVPPFLSNTPRRTCLGVGKEACCVARCCDLMMVMMMERTGSGSDRSIFPDG